MSRQSGHTEAMAARLLSFAWNQWAQIGLSGEFRQRSDWAVDPEALLVFTLQLGRREPRLFDEVHDWLLRNLDLVSIQRARNLVHDDETKRLVDAATSWASEHSTKVTRRQAKPVGSVDPVVLFTHQAGAPIGEPDPIFAAHGFTRPLLRPSGKSSTPPRHSPVCFAFLLRDLFGVTARAEIVRVLLTARGSELRTKDIVRLVAFGRRQVHDTLSSLASAGVIEAKQLGPRDTRYTIETERWLRLVGRERRFLPGLVEWPLMFKVLRSLLIWSEGLDSEQASSYIRGSSARQFISEHKSDLLAIGVRGPDDREYLGAAYYEAFLALVVEPLLDRLELNLEHQAM